MKADKADSKNQIAFLQELLSQIRLDDAKVKTFIEQEINNKQKGGKQKEISREIIRRLKIQNNKLLNQVASLKEQLKDSSANRERVLAKLNDLEELNSSLSKALGSCPVCWGEDENCKSCGGLGVPGWGDIDKRMFNLYILPSLEKLYVLKK